MTMGDPIWHANMLKSQAKNRGDKLSFKKTTWTITSKKCSQDMTMGDPIWHADMLKSQSNNRGDKLSLKSLHEQLPQRNAAITLQWVIQTDMRTCCKVK
jgi:hypothetical protein